MLGGILPAGSAAGGGAHEVPPSAPTAGGGAAAVSLPGWICTPLRCGAARPPQPRARLPPPVGAHGVPGSSWGTPWLRKLQLRQSPKIFLVDRD